MKKIRKAAYPGGGAAFLYFSGWLFYIEWWLRKVRRAYRRTSVPGGPHRPSTKPEVRRNGPPASQLGFQVGRCCLIASSGSAQFGVPTDRLPFQVGRCCLTASSGSAKFGVPTGELPFQVGRCCNIASSGSANFGVPTDRFPSQVGQDSFKPPETSEVALPQWRRLCRRGCGYEGRLHSIRSQRAPVPHPEAPACLS